MRADLIFAFVASTSAAAVAISSREVETAAPAAVYDPALNEGDTYFDEEPGLGWEGVIVPGQAPVVVWGHDFEVSTPAPRMLRVQLGRYSDAVNVGHRGKDPQIPPRLLNHHGRGAAG